MENQRLCSLQSIDHTADIAVLHHERLKCIIILILLVCGGLCLVQTVPKLFAAMDCCLSGNSEVFEGLQGSFYLLFGFCKLVVGVFHHCQRNSVFGFLPVRAVVS